MSLKRILFPIFCLMFAHAGLSVAAVPTPKISTTPTSVKFGSVKLGLVSAPQTITIKNTGTSALTILGINITGTNAADFAQNNSCGIIQSGGSCNVSITFTPNLPFANKAAVLAVNSNDPKKPTLNVKLSGAAPPPVISTPPLSLSYGKLAAGVATAQKTIIIKNKGLSDLIIESIATSGANPGHFSFSNHCNSIPTGDSCTIDVLFAPQVAAAKSSASLNISSNDPKKPNVSFKLSGQAPTVLPKPPKTAVINKFGQGLVVDNTGAINCGSTCSTQYDEGNVVTFTATPADGWHFHHWTGCDIASGNSCTVTMNSNKTIYPTFNTTTTTLKPNVIQLDDSTMSLLQDQAGTTLIFDISASIIAALKPGDVILSLSGYGLARKVKAVTILPGASIFVETDNAVLQDIISNGTIVYNNLLTDSDIRTANPLMEGAKLVRKADALDANFTIELNRSVGPLNIIGSTTFTIEPDIAVSANPIQGINEFKTAFNITHTTNMTLSSSASVSLVDKKIPLYNLVFAPIIAGPVVLVPIVNVDLVIKGESEVGLTANVTYSEKADIGIQYLKSTGWQSIHNYTNNRDFQEPTFTGSASLKGAVAASTNILIYGLAGPYVSLEGYLQAKATETVNASETCVEWGLYLGVGASAGGKVSIVGYDLADFDVDLFDLSWPLKKGSTGGCKNTVPPSVPQNLLATAISLSEIRLTWDASTGKNIVEGYNIKRDNSKLGSNANTLFTDSNLSPGKTYCYSVTAFDQSSNESDSSSVVCATTKTQDATPPTAPSNVTATAVSSNAIQLKWNASTDDNAVAGYSIYRNSLHVNTVNNLTSNDLGLKPNTQYCYNISAFDEAGNESVLSNQACATTKSVGAWTIYLACEGQSYILQNNLDLDETITSNIQVTGTGNDYDGTKLAYVIMGTYDNLTSLLDGRMTFTFQGNSCVRVDTFEADLSKADSGDSVMNQIQSCGGCTAVIRFEKTGGVSSASRSLNNPVSNSKYLGKQ